MKLNLRKARKLEKKIRDQINLISFDPTAKMSIANSVDDICNEIKIHGDNFHSNLQAVTDLIDVIYDIRDKIDKANHDNSGISFQMNEMKFLETKLEILEQINTDASIPSEEEIQLALDSGKSRLENGRSYDRELTERFYIITEDRKKFINKERKSIKREIEDVEDNIAKLNLSQSIKLAPAVVKLLKDNDIL